MANRNVITLSGEFSTGQMSARIKALKSAIEPTRAELTRLASEIGKIEAISEKDRTSDQISGLKKLKSEYKNLSDVLKDLEAETTRNARAMSSLAKIKLKGLSESTGSEISRAIKEIDTKLRGFTGKQREITVGIVGIDGVRQKITITREELEKLKREAQSELKVRMGGFGNVLEEAKALRTNMEKLSPLAREKRAEEQAAAQQVIRQYQEERNVFTENIEHYRTQEKNLFEERKQYENTIKELRGKGVTTNTAYTDSDIEKQQKLVENLAAARESAEGKVTAARQKATEAGVSEQMMEKGVVSAKETGVEVQNKVTKAVEQTVEAQKTVAPVVKDNTEAVVQQAEAQAKVNEQLQKTVRLTAEQKAVRDKKLQDISGKITAIHGVDIGAKSLAEYDNAKSEYIKKSAQIQQLSDWERSSAIRTKILDGGDVMETGNPLGSNDKRMSLQWYEEEIRKLSIVLGDLSESEANGGKTTEQLMEEIRKAKIVLHDYRNSIDGVNASNTKSPLFSAEEANNAIYSQEAIDGSLKKIKLRIEELQKVYEKQNAEMQKFNELSSMPELGGIPESIEKSKTTLRGLGSMVRTTFTDAESEVPGVFNDFNAKFYGIFNSDLYRRDDKFKSSVDKLLSEFVSTLKKGGEAAKVAGADIINVEDEIVIKTDDMFEKLAALSKQTRTPNIESTIRELRALSSAYEKGQAASAQFAVSRQQVKPVTSNAQEEYLSMMEFSKRKELGRKYGQELGIDSTKDILPKSVYERIDAEVGKYIESLKSDKTLAKKVLDFYRKMAEGIKADLKAHDDGVAKLKAEFGTTRNMTEAIYGPFETYKTPKGQERERRGRNIANLQQTLGIRTKEHNVESADGSVSLEGGIPIADAKQEGLIRPLLREREQALNGNAEASTKTAKATESVTKAVETNTTAVEKENAAAKTEIKLTTSRAEALEKLYEELVKIGKLKDKSRAVKTDDGRTVLENGVAKTEVYTARQQFTDLYTKKGSDIGLSRMTRDRGIAMQDRDAYRAQISYLQDVATKDIREGALEQGSRLSMLYKTQVADAVSKLGTKGDAVLKNAAKTLGEHVNQILSSEIFGKDAGFAANAETAISEMVTRLSEKIKVVAESGQLTKLKGGLRADINAEKPLMKALAEKSKEPSGLTEEQLNNPAKAIEKLNSEIQKCDKYINILTPAIDAWKATEGGVTTAVEKTAVATSALTKEEEKQVAQSSAVIEQNKVIAETVKEVIAEEENRGVITRNVAEDGRVITDITQAEVDAHKQNIGALTKEAEAATKKEQEARKLLNTMQRSQESAAELVSAEENKRQVETELAEAERLRGEAEKDLIDFENQKGEAFKKATAYMEKYGASMVRGEGDIIATINALKAARSEKGVTPAQYDDFSKQISFWNIQLRELQQNINISMKNISKVSDPVLLTLKKHFVDITNDVNASEAAINRANKALVKISEQEHKRGMKAATATVDTGSMTLGELQQRIQVAQQLQKDGATTRKEWLKLQQVINDSTLAIEKFRAEQTKVQARTDMSSLSRSNIGTLSNQEISDAVKRLQQYAAQTKLTTDERNKLNRAIERGNAVLQATASGDNLFRMTEQYNNYIKVQKNQAQITDDAMRRQQQFWLQQLSLVRSGSEEEKRYLDNYLNTSKAIENRLNRQQGAAQLATQQSVDALSAKSLNELTREQLQLSKQVLEQKELQGRISTEELARLSEIRQLEFDRGAKLKQNTAEMQRQAELSRYQSIADSVASLTIREDLLLLNKEDYELVRKINEERIRSNASNAEARGILVEMLRIDNERLEAARARNVEASKMSMADINAVLDNPMANTAEKVKQAVEQAKAALKEMMNNGSSSADTMQQLATKIENVESAERRFNEESKRMVAAEKLRDIHAMSSQALIEQEKLWKAAVDGENAASVKLGEYQKNLDKVRERLRVNELMNAQSSLGVNMVGTPTSLGGVMNTVSEIHKNGGGALADIEHGAYKSLEHMKQLQREVSAFKEKFADPKDVNGIKMLDESLAKVTYDIRVAENGLMAMGAATAELETLANMPAQALNKVTFNADRLNKSLEAELEYYRRIGDAHGVNKATKAIADLKVVCDKAGVSTKAVADASKQLGVDWDMVNKIAANPSAEKSIQKLKAAYNALKSSVDTATDSQKRYNEVANDLRRIDAQIQHVQANIHSNAGFLMKFFQNVKSYATFYFGAFAIMMRIQSLISGNKELSDSMANVGKVTGATNREMEVLTENIQKINTRTATSELMKMAEQAGKLGIYTRAGAKGVEDFVRVADKITKTLGEDIGGAEAVGDLVKLNDLLVKNGGLGDNLEKLGSAILSVGNNSAASYEGVVSFLRQTGATGSVSGLTATQLTALGATYSSLGAKMDQSATSTNKFIVGLQRNAEAVARTIGMSSIQLREMINNDDTFGALQAIIDRIHQLGESGQNVASVIGNVLKAIGGRQNAQMFTAMSLLVDNAGRLREELEYANEAYKEGTLMSDEYARVQDTLAGQMAKIGKSFQDTFTNPELQHFLVWIVSKFAALADNVLSFRTAVVLGIAALWSLSKSLITLNVLNNKVISGLVILGKDIRTAYHNIGRVINVAKNEINGINAATIVMRQHGQAVAASSVMWAKMGVVARATIAGIKAALMSTGIMALVMALTWGVMKLWDVATRESIDDKTGNSFNDATTEANNNIAKMREAYDKLSEKKGIVIGLSNEFNKLKGDTTDVVTELNNLVDSGETLTENQQKILNKNKELTHAQQDYESKLAEFNSQYSNYIGFQLTDITNGELVAAVHEKIAAALRNEALARAGASNDEAIVEHYKDAVQNQVDDLTTDAKDMTGGLFTRNKFKKGVDPYAVVENVRATIDDEIAKYIKEGVTELNGLQISDILTAVDKNAKKYMRDGYTYSYEESNASNIEEYAKVVMEREAKRAANKNSVNERVDKNNLESSKADITIASERTRDYQSDFGDPDKFSAMTDNQRSEYLSGLDKYIRSLNELADQKAAVDTRISGLTTEREKLDAERRQTNSKDRKKEIDERLSEIADELVQQEEFKRQYSTSLANIASVKAEAQEAYRDFSDMNKQILVESIWGKNAEEINKMGAAQLKATHDKLNEVNKMIKDDVNVEEILGALKNGEANNSPFFKIANQIEAAAAVAQKANTSVADAMRQVLDRADETVQKRAKDTHISLSGNFKHPGDKNKWKSEAKEQYNAYIKELDDYYVREQMKLDTLRAKGELMQLEYEKRNSALEREHESKRSKLRNQYMEDYRTGKLYDEMIGKLSDKDILDIYARQRKDKESDSEFLARFKDEFAKNKKLVQKLGDQFVDELKLKSDEDQLKILQIWRKSQDEFEKAVIGKNPFSKVVDDFTSNMDKLHLLFGNADFERQLINGTEHTDEEYRKRIDILRSYSVQIASMTEGEFYELLRATSEFAEYTEEEMALLYDKLLQLRDDYDEAARKQAKKEVKLLDNRMESGQLYLDQITSLRKFEAELRTAGKVGTEAYAQVKGAITALEGKQNQVINGRVITYFQRMKTLLEQLNRKIKIEEAVGKTGINNNVALGKYKLEAASVEFSQARELYMNRTAYANKLKSDALTSVQRANEKYQASRSAEDYANLMALQAELQAAQVMATEVESDTLDKMLEKQRDMAEQEAEVLSARINNIKEFHEAYKDLISKYALANEEAYQNKAFELAELRAKKELGLVADTQKQRFLIIKKNGEYEEKWLNQEEQMLTQIQIDAHNARMEAVQEALGKFAEQISKTFRDAMNRNIELSEEKKREADRQKVIRDAQQESMNIQKAMEHDFTKFIQSELDARIEQYQAYYKSLAAMSGASVPKVVTTNKPASVHSSVSISTNTPMSLPKVDYGDGTSKVLVEATSEMRNLFTELATNGVEDKAKVNKLIEYLEINSDDLNRLIAEYRKNNVDFMLDAGNMKEISVVADKIVKAEAGNPVVAALDSNVWADMFKSALLQVNLDDTIYKAFSNSSKDGVEILSDPEVWKSVGISLGMQAGTAIAGVLNQKLSEWLMTVKTVEAREGVGATDRQRRAAAKQREAALDETIDKAKAELRVAQRSQKATEDVYGKGGYGSDQANDKVLAAQAAVDYAMAYKEQYMAIYNENRKTIKHAQDAMVSAAKEFGGNSKEYQDKYQAYVDTVNTKSIDKISAEASDKAVKAMFGEGGKYENSTYSDGTKVAIAKPSSESPSATELVRDTLKNISVDPVVRAQQQAIEASHADTDKIVQAIQGNEVTTNATDVEGAHYNNVQNTKSALYDDIVTNHSEQWDRDSEFGIADRDILADSIVKISESDVFGESADIIATGAAEGATPEQVAQAEQLKANMMLAVWEEYYDNLSKLKQSELDEATASGDAEQIAVIKNQQAQIDVRRESVKKQIKEQSEANKKMVKAENAKQAAIGTAEQVGAAASTAVGDMVAQATGNQMLGQLSASIAQAGANALIGIAQGTANSANQGWWMPAIVQPILTSILMGLLGMATKKTKSAQSTIAQATGAKAGKLTTGMLTYATGRYNDENEHRRTTSGMLSFDNGYNVGESYAVDGADGKSYNGKYVGSVSDMGTGLVKGTHFGIFSEVKPEMVIDGDTTKLMHDKYPMLENAILTLHRTGSLNMQNMLGLDYNSISRTIDTLTKNGSLGGSFRMPTFASGRYPNSTSNTMFDADSNAVTQQPGNVINEQLAATLSALQQTLASGIGATVDSSQASRALEKQRKFEQRNKIKRGLGNA